MKAWLGLLLLVPMGLSYEVPNTQQLTREQKNAFLSRKKWYLSYEFTASGNGASESGQGEEYSKTTWRVGRRTTGLIQLNFAIPGKWPPSHKPDAFTATQTGRFIAWMPLPPEQTQQLMAAGERNPAKLPGAWFPYQPEAFDRTEREFGGHTNIDSYTLNGTGYTDGACMLYVDLQDNIYEVVFQSQPSGLGDKAKHEWIYKYPGEPDNEGSKEIEIPEQYTAWFPKDAQPLLIERKLLPDLKPDGSIVFSLANSIDLPQWGKVGYGVTFRFSPTPPSTAELVLTPEQDYSLSWRPKPGISETETEHDLCVNWEVNEKGVPANERAKVKKVTFRLGNVSRYPGICMNWPPGATAKGAKLDLSFDPELPQLNEDYTVRDENQVLIVDGKTAEQRKGSVFISCFDAAAIGELVVEAELSDQRILTGYFAGKPTLKKVLIPDREEGVSDLPKWWRTAWTSGERDDSDEETEPEGDKDAPGDGLTLWEEYRGFYEGGAWSDSCNSKKKDLFIDDRVGAAAQTGLSLFRSITGLAIHDELLPAEHLGDMVINYLSRADRHEVDQHCLLLKETTGNVGKAHKMPGKQFPGPPKNTLSVRVVLNRLPAGAYSPVPGVTFTRSVDAWMISHELGHGIGIYHHGDQDYEMKWIRSVSPGILPGSTPTEQIIEGHGGGPVIQVLGENLTRWTADEIFGIGGNETVVWVGVENGQHSGDGDCVMRYVVAEAYPRKGQSNAFVYHRQLELPGALLCTSSAGTLVNYITRDPQSRYGDAKLNRGDCAHQFVINDNFDKKYR